MAPSEFRDRRLKANQDFPRIALKPVIPQDLVQFWPWSGSHAFRRVGQQISPHSKYFGAIWLPGSGKRRRLKDAESESDAEGNLKGRASQKRGLIPRVDVHKLFSRVQQNLHHHLSGVRRQLARYQQGFKQHREKRAAKKGQGKPQRNLAPQKRRHSKYGAEIDDLMSRALAFERKLDVRNAIRCYEEILKHAPDSYEHLALCSKAWSDATYLDEIHNEFREPLSTQDKRDVNTKAKDYAEKALALQHDTSLPEVAACVSRGRLALFSDNKAKVALAKDARENAIAAIEKEPSSDLAHHLMGRWHWEMAQLNVVVRTLIRIAFGTALPSGSHSDALDSYATACKLAPHRLIHRVELGRAYHKLGKREAAWRELEAAILLDQEDINAYLQKIDADILLKELRRDAKRFGWKTELDPSNAASDAKES